MCTSICPTNLIKIYLDSLFKGQAFLRVLTASYIGCTYMAENWCCPIAYGKFPPPPPPPPIMNKNFTKLAH